MSASAAFSLALADKLEEALPYVAAIRAIRPRYTFAEFLAAFRVDAAGTANFRKGASRLGMS